jgi:putative addiction module component (TIGR02574 family)
MNITEWKEQFLPTLTKAERDQLALEIWESSQDERPNVLLRDELRAELLRRAKAADTGEAKRHPWEAVEQRLRDRWK